MAEDKAASKASWSDAERIALLVTMLDAKGGPDWKGIALPPGRTKKACLHVWSKLKEEAKKADWYQAPNKGNATSAKAETDEDGANDEEPAKVTPKKRAAKDEGMTPKKRAKKADEAEVGVEVKARPDLV